MLKFNFFGTLFSCSYLCSQTTKGFYLYSAFNHNGTRSDRFSWHLASEQRPPWMNMTPCSRSHLHIAVPLRVRQHAISSGWILLEEQALKEPRAWGASPDASCQKAAAAFEPHTCRMWEDTSPPWASCRSPGVSADIPQGCSKDCVSGPAPFHTSSRSPGQTCSTSPKAAGMAKPPWKQNSSPVKYKQTSATAMKPEWKKLILSLQARIGHSVHGFYAAQRMKNPSWIKAEQWLCQFFARAMHSQHPLSPGGALERGKSLFHLLYAESWKERGTSGHFYSFPGSL